METGIDKTTMDDIKANLLTHRSANPDDYAMAAEYLYYLNSDLEIGDMLIRSALTQNKELWYYRLRIDILERLKKFKEASTVADEAIEWINSRQDLSQAEKSEYRIGYENRKKELLSKCSSK